jgi:hypothetical protein
MQLSCHFREWFMYDVCLIKTDLSQPECSPEISLKWFLVKLSCIVDETNLLFLVFKGGQILTDSVLSGEIVQEEWEIYQWIRRGIKWANSRIQKWISMARKLSLGKDAAANAKVVHKTFYVLESMISLFPGCRFSEIIFSFVFYLVWRYSRLYFALSEVQCQKTAQ